MPLAYEPCQYRSPEDNLNDAKAHKVHSVQWAMVAARPGNQTVGLAKGLTRLCLQWSSATGRSLPVLPREPNTPKLRNIL